MNLGLRWDVYVPWVEKDNRQSNFDETTGKFVVASDNAVVNGVEVGRYLQTYSKRDLGPRFGLAYDLTGDGKTMIRGGFGVFWNFTPGGTSSSKAQNPPFLQATALNADPIGLRQQPAAQGWPAGASRRRSATGPRPARRGRSSTSTSATRTRGSGTSTSSGPLHELHAGGGLRRLAGPADADQGRPEPGATGRRRNRLERESSLHRGLAGSCARSARCRAGARSTTTRCW